MKCNRFCGKVQGCRVCRAALCGSVRNRRSQKLTIIGSAFKDLRPYVVEINDVEEEALAVGVVERDGAREKTTRNERLDQYERRVAECAGRDMTTL